MANKLKILLSYVKLKLYFDLDLVGHHDIYSNDSNWRDLVLFYEFFHPETGRGCGARCVNN